MKKGGARLGQHFLNAPWAAKALVHAAAIQPGDTVLEIGPGKGALTKVLLMSGNNVIAIEKDEVLAERLHETFAAEIAQGRLHIVTGDVRDADPQKLGLTSYVLAANIPYYITGEIIRQFLTAEVQPHTMALLIQKEVAQRITSKNKESILSLSVKAYGTPKIVEKVSRTCFSPAPNVDSAILAIGNISKDFFKDLNEEHFFAVVHAGFASKRKFLASNLGAVFGKEKVLAAFMQCSLSEKVRAEDVGLGEWKKIATQLL